MEEILHQLRLVVYPHYFQDFHTCQVVGLGIPEASTVATTWKPHDLCVIRLEMTFSTQALRLLLSAHLNRSRPPRTAPQPRGRLHLEKKKNYRRRKTWVVQHRNDFMNPGFFVAFAMICLFACISTGKYVMKFNCGFLHHYYYVVISLPVFIHFNKGHLWCPAPRL